MMKYKAFKTTPPMPPPTRVLKNHKFLIQGADKEEVVWPRTAREESIFKQGEEQERAKFNWHCAGVGFGLASLFWGACIHFWGVQ